MRHGEQDLIQCLCQCQHYHGLSISTQSSNKNTDANVPPNPDRRPSRTLIYHNSGICRVLLFSLVSPLACACAWLWPVGLCLTVSSWRVLVYHLLVCAWLCVAELPFCFNCSFVLKSLSLSLSISISHTIYASLHVEEIKKFVVFCVTATGICLIGQLHCVRIFWNK